MKWSLVALVCLAAVSVHGLDEVTVRTEDVLDESFYGLDEIDRSDVSLPEETDSSDVPQTEETDEVDSSDEAPTTIHPGDPNSRRRHHGGDRHHDGRGRHGGHGRGGHGGHGRGGHGGHGRGGHGGHGRHHHRRPGFGNWTTEQKVNHICQKLSAPSDHRMQRVFQHKFSRMTVEQREAAQQLISARKAAMTACCDLVDEERVQCAENLHNQRYDRVCEGEESLCMWAELRGDSSTRTQISAIVDRCCASEGSERYGCFSEVRSQYSRSYHRRD